MRFLSPTQLMITAILPLAGAVASASVTYDFTGTVYDQEGIFSSLPANTTISGSLTIDLEAYKPGLPYSDTNSTYWQRYSFGGSDEQLPPPTALVYTESITVNGTTYSTGPIGTTENNPQVGVISGCVEGQADGSAGFGSGRRQ